MVLIVNARSIGFLGAATLVLAACDGPAANTATELIPPGEIGDTECENAAETLWREELGDISPVNREELKRRAELCQVTLEDDFEDFRPAATTEIPARTFARRLYAPEFASCYLTGPRAEDAPTAEECKRRARDAVRAGVSGPGAAPDRPGPDADPIINPDLVPEPTPLPTPTPGPSLP